MTEELRWYPKYILAIDGRSSPCFDVVSWLISSISPENCRKYQLLDKLPGNWDPDRNTLVYMSTPSAQAFWHEPYAKLSRTSSQRLEAWNLWPTENSIFSSFNASSTFLGNSSRTSCRRLQALDDMARSKSRYDRALQPFFAMQTFQGRSQGKPPMLYRSSHMSSGDGTPSCSRILLISASVLDRTIPGLQSFRSLQICFILFSLLTNPGIIIVSSGRDQSSVRFLFLYHSSFAFHAATSLRSFHRSVRFLPLSCLLAICRKFHSWLIPRGLSRSWKTIDFTSPIAYLLARCVFLSNLRKSCALIPSEVIIVIRNSSRFGLVKDYDISKDRKFALFF